MNGKMKTIFSFRVEMPSFSSKRANSGVRRRRVACLLRLKVQHEKNARANERRSISEKPGYVDRKSRLVKGMLTAGMHLC